MVMVLVMMGLLRIDHTLNISKLLHVARYGDSSLLIKPILLFRFLQQLHEERVIEICNRDYESLLLLPLADVDRQTPFRNISHLLLPMLMVWKVKVEVE